MAFFSFLKNHSVSRRRLLQAGIFGTVGLALYSGEIARHEVEVVERDITLARLPQVFDGLRIVQLSDFHLDGWTEPYFLREVVERVNRMQPDLVVLTGDFATEGFGPRKYQLAAARKCAEVLSGLHCGERYAALGNHDIGVGRYNVVRPLKDNGIPVLRNSCVPIERGSGRIWLSGVDDPLLGHPNLDQAIPYSIRNVPDEPVVLLCHEPDYADTVLKHESGPSVGLMLSGHTHGGQVRLPFFGAVELPEMGRKYVEGLFQLGSLQLYVNRGIGTIGLPFRLNCPPEITVLTLRAA